MNEEHEIRGKAVLVGFLVDNVGGFLGGLVAASVAAVSLTLRGVPSQELGSAIARLAWVQPFSLATGLLFSAIGGYVGAVLAPRAEIRNAFGVGACSFLFALALFAVFPDASPRWATFTSLVLAIPLAVLGGYARLVTNKTAEPVG